MNEKRENDQLSLNGFDLGFAPERDLVLVLEMRERTIGDLQYTA